MYRIYADDVLIYDSTIEDYKIGKGAVTLEAGKSGSFVFSLYPDHFYYDRFVKLRTIVTVYKDKRIVFRGRVLSDAVDYWNVKTLTCEGELGFLNDSVIVPWQLNADRVEERFAEHIEQHNYRMEEFKQFKVGTVSESIADNFVAEADDKYVSTMESMNDRVLNDLSGVYLHVTHGDDGTDPVPTIHLLSDFGTVATQSIEFGENLKNYAKTAKAETLATAIFPVGRDGRTMPGQRCYENAAGIAMYGTVIKVVEFPDADTDGRLEWFAKEYMNSGACTQLVTVELNAVDLHLFDKSIDSFRVCEYIEVSSAPHNFNATLLCQKQTLDLLKPENDTVVLGATYSSFTDKSNKGLKSVNKAVNSSSGATKEVSQSVNDLTLRVETLEQSGSGGVGIKSVEQTTRSTEDDGDNVVTVTLTNGQVNEFFVQNGSKGSRGASGYSPRASVARTDTGAKISITDELGTTEAEVYDGTAPTDKIVLTDTATGAKYRVEITNGEIAVTEEV